MADDHHALPNCIFKLTFKYCQFHTVNVLLTITIFMSIALTTITSAIELPLTVADAKKLWNRTCFSCHGDSSDMARKFLKVVDGHLQGPLHKATFRTFLTNHYLSKRKADAIYSMLLAQTKTRSRFEQECSRCHKKTTDFVREKLTLYKGILYSKKTKTPVYAFLETHRDLNKKDVNFFIRKLTLIGYEIYQPIKVQ